ncbi:hypothetical protein RRF57_006041 [Xylaria bambusicola]|uniref:Uncharacterized protein n=1 Tax=Xylaria bambusicola TaxID=326684 RepID=A0AAN7URG4_9PEZI
MSPDWALDVSSFLVLLSENEELGFRQASKRLPDVLSLAPVSGLQAYLRSYATVIDVQDREYLSPYGRKRAPLRNMRVARMISQRGVLDDGQVAIYQISNAAQSSPQKRRVSAACWLLTAISWISFAALVFVAFWVKSVTWVGKSNFLAFALWSVYLRAVDAASFVPSKTTSSFPDSPDVAVFLGRRNSAFIIEGSRKDIVQWTGLGLSYRANMPRRWQQFFERISGYGTRWYILIVAFMFSTIPNGSFEDQIIFVAYNVLGQLNTWLGLYLHTHRTLLDLRAEVQIPAPTRTHVYATLIRRYGDENWSDSDVIPKTPTWDMWRRRVIIEATADPKELWEECYKSNEGPSKTGPL